MNTIKRCAMKLTTLLCLASLFLTCLPMVCAAENGVRVTIGKPSIWTLAQAYYLLAQMHQQDRGWKLANLGDLDPNSINRQRIEVVQTLLGISAEYDQTAGFKNKTLRERYETNYSRQQSVKSEIDRRNDELIQATRDLYYVEIDLNRLKAAIPPDQKAIDAKTAEKDAKSAEKQVITSRIGTLNSELTALGSENLNAAPGLSGPFSGAQPAPSPMAPSLSKLIDNQFLKDVYKDSANKSSQLQASIRLDNYIQMQYEIISKQLTLLRDEAGPDQRVIFLELPSSI